MCLNWDFRLLEEKYTHKHAQAHTYVCKLMEFFLIDLVLQAEANTDEVFAQITLLPVAEVS